MLPVRKWYVYFAIHIVLHISSASPINEPITIKSITILPLNYLAKNDTDTYIALQSTNLAPDVSTLESTFSLIAHDQFNIITHLYPDGWSLTNADDSFLSIVLETPQVFTNKNQDLIICISTSNRYISIFFDLYNDQSTRVYPSSQSELAPGDIQQMVRSMSSKWSLRFKLSGGTSFRGSDYAMSPESIINSFPLTLHLKNYPSKDEAHIIVESSDGSSQTAVYLESFDMDNGIDILIGNGNTETISISSISIVYSIAQRTNNPWPITTTTDMSTIDMSSTFAMTGSSSDTTGEWTSTEQSITTQSATDDHITSSTNAHAASTTMIGLPTETLHVHITEQEWMSTEQPHDMFYTSDRRLKPKQVHVRIHGSHLHVDSIIFGVICVSLCCCGIVIGWCCKNKRIDTNAKREHMELKVGADEECDGVKPMKTHSQLNRDIMNDIKDVMDGYIASSPDIQHTNSNAMHWNKNRSKNGFVELQTEPCGEVEGHNIVALPGNTEPNEVRQRIIENDDANSDEEDGRENVIHDDDDDAKSDADNGNSIDGSAMPMGNTAQRHTKVVNIGEDDALFPSTTGK
eukprot:444777_1